MPSWIDQVVAENQAWRAAEEGQRQRELATEALQQKNEMESQKAAALSQAIEAMKPGFKIGGAPVDVGGFSQGGAPMQQTVVGPQLQRPMPFAQAPAQFQGPTPEQEMEFKALRRKMLGLPEQLAPEKLEDAITRALSTRNTRQKMDENAWMEQWLFDPDPAKRGQAKTMLDEMMNRKKAEKLVVEAEQEGKIQNALDAAAVKKGLQELPKLQAAAQTASNSKEQIRRAKELIKEGVTGKGGQLKAFLAPYAEMLGVPSEELSKAQAYQLFTRALVGPLRLDLIGAGPVSEWEQKLMQRLSGGGGVAKEAAIELLNYYDSLAENKLKLYDETVENLAPLYPRIKTLYKPMGTKTLTALPGKKSRTITLRSGKKIVVEE